MSAVPDPVRLPDPAWLAGHSTPVIDALLEGRDDDTRRLYRRYLADEVRAMNPDAGGRTPAWRAFDRAVREVLIDRGAGPPS
jgi:hypothetical protein